MNKLDAALDAARTGIARLARQVHYDREERSKALSNIRELADDIGSKVVMPTLEQVLCVEYRLPFQHLPIQTDNRPELGRPSSVAGCCRCVSSSSLAERWMPMFSHVQDFRPGPGLT